MKRYVKAANSLPEGITRMTFDEDYSMSGGDWPDEEEYAQDMFDMHAEEIRYLYSSNDGGNVDTGIETTDGKFYIAYSGHGVAPCSSYDEMIQHLQM